jgi:hypothetical protein
MSFEAKDSLVKLPTINLLGFSFSFFQICDIENLVNHSKNEQNSWIYTRKKSQYFCCKTNKKFPKVKTLANTF